MSHARTKLLCTTLLVGGLGLGLAPFTPSLIAPPAYAQQRTEIRQEFRVALEPYGQFERHSRYGEVWRPTRVARDWRPYTVGRWVYNDDLGWYWNAAESEADWGWVAFHYGRWIDDKQMGWVWVPGDEWAPAWVNWRRGEGPAVAARGGRSAEEVRYIGWAPLPPEDISDSHSVEYRDDPQMWTFVRARDIVSPRVNTVIIRERQPAFFRSTVVVNRTVVVRDRGVNVNPGISPGYVAAFVGRPVVSYDVRPRVIVGTTRYNNAVEIRGDDLRDRRRFQALRKEQPAIRETRTRIEAVRDVPQARALESSERGGRLGDRPPRAAQGPDQRRDGDQRGERTQRDERRNGEPTSSERMNSDRRAPGQQAPGERPGSVTQEQRETERNRTGAPSQAQTPPARNGDAPDRPNRATTDKPATERSTATEKPTAPARAGGAPARNEATPGQPPTPPGRAADTPAPSGAKPPAQAGGSPGQPGPTPGRAADTPARQQERGAQQRDERSQQNRAAPQPREERAQPNQTQRGESTGTTPNRGATGAQRGAGEAPRGASEAPRERRAPQRPEGGEPRREAQ